MTAVFGQVAAEIIRGDISEVEADVIVNAANSELWMGSGVADALKRKGGQEIENEAMSKGPIAVGEAVATSAGKLRTRWIVHAAVMGSDLMTDSDKIRRATRNSLVKAEELGAKTIALPSLGTGVGGFPLEEAAQIMIEEVARFARHASKLELAMFVLFSENAERAFQVALERAVKSI